MLRYRNAPMSRDEALDIAIDLGPLLAHRDAIGRQVPGTTSLRVVPSGAGYDIVIPAEHAAQVVAVLGARLPRLGVDVAPEQSRG